MRSRNQRELIVLMLLKRFLVMIMVRVEKKLGREDPNALEMLMDRVNDPIKRIYISILEERIPIYLRNRYRIVLMILCSTMILKIMKIDIFKRSNI